MLIQQNMMPYSDLRPSRSDLSSSAHASWNFIFTSTLLTETGNRILNCYR